MPESGDDGGFDWVESLVALAGLVGMNKVRVRWKLMRYREAAAQQGRRARARAAHVGYEHKVCPRCGTINDRDATTCVKCEDRLRSHRWQQVERVGLSVPDFLSVSTALCITMLAIYAFLATESAGGLWSLDSLTLLRHGGSYPPAIRAGEVWRLGTSIFLHAGLWHIGFNVIALWQIGPLLEQLYGRHRMLFFFMVTGIVAALGSSLFRPGGVGIGASGAIMGLIGLAAGWGQRDGTTVGRGVRNRMIKWAIYVMIFGWFIGADNLAHGVGFGAGALIGYLAPALRPRDTGMSPLSVVMGVVGVLAAVLSAALTVVPIPGARDWAAEDGFAALASSPDDWLGEAADIDPETTAEQWRASYRPWLEVCAADAAGDREGAEALLRSNYPGVTWGGATGVDPFATCDTVVELVENCGRFRVIGVDAVLDTERVQLTEAQAEGIARQWGAICTGIERAHAEVGFPE